MTLTKVVHCKKKPYDVYIGRPSKWGNPYVIGKDGDRSQVIYKYMMYIFMEIDKNPLLEDEIMRELGGKILGCYCYPQRCHGYILAAIADGKGYQMGL